MINLSSWIHQNCLSTFSKGLNVNIFVLFVYETFPECEASMKDNLRLVFFHEVATDKLPYALLRSQCPNYG